jgi:hypothetical protein
LFRLINVVVFVLWQFFIYNLALLDQIFQAIQVYPKNSSFRAPSRFLMGPLNTIFRFPKNGATENNLSISYKKKIFIGLTTSDCSAGSLF